MTRTGRWTLSIAALVTVVTALAIGEAGRRRSRAPAESPTAALHPESDSGAVEAAAALTASPGLVWTGTTALVLAEMEPSGRGRRFAPQPVHTFTLAEQTTVSVSATSEDADTMLRLVGDTGIVAENDDDNGIGAPTVDEELDGFTACGGDSARMAYWDPRIIVELAPGTYHVFVGAMEDDAPMDWTVRVNVRTGVATQDELDAIVERQEDLRRYVRALSATQEIPFSTANGDTWVLQPGVKEERIVRLLLLNPMDVLSAYQNGYGDASRPALTVTIPHGVSGTLVMDALADEVVFTPMLYVVTDRGESAWGRGTDLEAMRVEMPVSGGERVHLFPGSRRPFLDPIAFQLGVWLE